MKANLKAGGLSSSFVDSLAREDLIAGAQMAVWTYANAADGAKDGLGYFATVSQRENKVVVCGGVQYAVKPVMVNGSVLTLTTNENGYAQSPELDCGTYFLVETVAPAGYNLSDEAFSVTVVSSEIKTVLVKIPNQAGVLLPETGGNGTAAFALVGCMMIALAAAMLAMKKRAALNK